jgi:hypothetical protein
MKVLEQPVRSAVTETRVDMPLLPKGQYLLSYQLKDERVIIPFILAN